MKKYLLGVAIIVVMYGCQSEKKDYALSESVSDTTYANTAGVTDTLASPKIIKTADMRFRVKDVQQTKEHITATLKAQGGTVVEFSINTIPQKRDKVKYSTDSLKEIIAYSKEGIIVAKVPSEKLDEFTNTVARLAVFVDHQTMKMDDRSMQYLANKLKAQSRAEALNTIRKLASKKNSNVESSLYIKDDYVDKKIQNMSIDDQVRYSTITLNFYQDHTVKTLIVGNDNLYDYRPGFFQRLGLNLVDGWVYFKEFILAISHLWILALLGIGVFLGVRFTRKKI